MVKVIHTDMPDGRCLNTLFEKGAKISEAWFLGDKSDRAGDLPAVVNFDPGSGRVIREEWHQAGRLHRPGKPAFIAYDSETGIAVEECWRLEGRPYRLDGPTDLKRDRLTGAVIYEEWTSDARKHRSNGPAVVYRNPESVVVGEEWWIAGKLADDQQYRDFTKHYTYQPWSKTFFTLKFGG